jgi:quercetin dioxygenase-like cupin family protein
VIVPIIGGEPILRCEKREISILVASEEVTITQAQYAAGEQVAAPHVHHEHTDAFYVLEGELTFEIGRDAKTITVSSGGFVAAPPQVAHSFRNDSDRPARWLTIHAHDGGFAAFMRAPATASRSSGTSTRSPPEAACRQAKRSSAPTSAASASSPGIDCAG